MEKGYKRGHRNISFMMKGKTLATIGALTALGLAVYAQSTPTIGQLAQAMKSNPSAWTVVVGANAKASDVVGASNIVAALETFTSVPTSSSVNTSSLQVTLQGPVPVTQGAYQLFTSGQPLYLGYALNQVMPVIQVGSGSFTVNYNGQQTTYSYTAYVYPSGSYTIKYIQPSVSQAPVVAVASSYQTNPILNLTVYFTPALNLTQLSQSPQAIQIFNTTYYIVPSSNGQYLNFVPAAQVVTLNVNQSVTFNGVTITLEGVAAQYSAGSTVSTGVPSAILNINGQTYTVEVGSQLYVDGVNILVTNVYGPLSTIVSTTQTGAVQLVLGTSGYQLPITQSPEYVQTSSGQTLDNVQVQMSVSGNNNNLVSSITFLFPLTQAQQIGTSGYYGIVNGGSYQLPLFNYQLTFPQVQIPSPNSDLVQVQATQSSNGYQFTVSFPDALSGKTYSLPVYVYNSSSTYPYSLFQPASTTGSPYVGEFVPASLATNSTVTTLTVEQNQYFAVYNSQANVSQIFEVTNVGPGSNGQLQATLQDVITGQTYTVYEGQPLIVADGIVLNVTSISTSPNSVTFQVLTSGYAVTTGALYLALKGPSPTQTPILALTLGSPVNVVLTENYPGYSVSSEQISFSLTSTGISASQYQEYSVSSGSVVTYYYLDQVGTYMQFITNTGSSSGSQTLSIYLPLTPVSYPIELAPVGAQTQYQTITVGVGQTIPGTQYTVEGVSGVSVTGYTQPTALIGKVILDTQVTSPMSNVVVVGGPAVNTLAASAIIQWVSEMNSTLGAQLQQLANSQGGYIYGSQLAPVLQQLNVSFGPGTALIFVGGQYTNELVIFGWSGKDTTEATVLFANYLVNNVDAQELNNATFVVLNDQQLTANNLPSIEEVQ